MVSALTLAGKTHRVLLTAARRLILSSSSPPAFNFISEDKMVGWHHRLNGHEFEQAPGDGEGEGSLVSCSPGVARVGHDRAAEQQQQQQTYRVSDLLWFKLGFFLGVG